MPVSNHMLKIPGELVANYLPLVHNKLCGKTIEFNSPNCLLKLEKVASTNESVKICAVPTSIEALYSLVN